MKLAFTTLACPQWDLRRIIQAAKESGYDGVDFRGYKGHIAFYELAEFTTGLDTTIRALKDAKLEVPCLSSSAKMFCKDEAAAQASLREVTTYAQLAARMGAPLVRVFGGSLGGVPWEQAVPRSVDHLRRLCDAAEPLGIGLAVETHDAWMATAPLGQVMQRVGRANAGALWDVHHPLQMAGEPIEQSWANIGRFVIYTHVKDSRKTGTGPDQVEYCLPGEGDIPLDAIVALLARGGYDGYLTVEWEKQWHPEIAEPEVALPAHAKALRQAIAKARK